MIMHSVYYENEPKIAYHQAIDTTSHLFESPVYGYYTISYQQLSA